jgi:hypothetical protein
MNRVIDGVDLDGLEFLRAEEALIEFRNGGIYIKLENTSSDYQREYSQKVLNGKWTPGDIGVSLKLSEISYSIRLQEKKPGLGEVPDQDMPKNLTGHTISGANNTTSNGGTPESGAWSSSPNNTLFNRASRAVGAINLVQEIHTQVSDISKNSDKIEIRNQKNIEAVNTISVLNKAISDGIVPSQYQNQSNLETISNVILSGNSGGNKALYDLGIGIFNKYAYPVISNPVDTGWGLDRPSPLPNRSIEPNPNSLTLKKR